MHSVATRTWFGETFERATPVQERGWERIAAGDHSLLIAPTGSGKTLAAFLHCLDRLMTGAPKSEPGVRVLYVSPLKALVYDVERNLRTPLAGIDRTAARLGLPVQSVDVGVRTGDTTTKDRRSHLKHPPDIFVTTPESLYLVLGSQIGEILRTVETVIIDEVHALAPTKRGAHLALSLERLAAMTKRDPQRIGLSATATPLAEVARYLGGDRPVSIVDTSQKPRIELSIVVPVPDMTRPELGMPEKQRPESTSLLAPTPPPEQRGIWPAIHPRLLELVRAHRSTIIFVNSRGLAERLSQQLNELAEEPLVRAHHGSLAHPQRRDIEEQLKAGTLRGIVATSSLELGIDMGAVDLVVLVESPGSVASGLQRVGRAGHHVGATSRGRVFPKHRGDLLEATVVGRRMLDGQIEPLRVPKNPLDVLAQQVVAICGNAPIHLEALERLVKRSASYRELPRDGLVAVLDMLSGRYPSTSFADLKPRLVWDRESDVLSARKGSKSLSLTSGGTIPDRGLYPVQLGYDGPRVGELDEEMVHETLPGQTFMLGASTWRVVEVTRDRVIVSPAPGEPGKLPFWKGDAPGRPLELGRAIGAFTREIAAMDDGAATTLLTEQYSLDTLAVKNLLAYIREQEETTGTLPTDRSITIERFQDELGDARVCILSPFGARVHAPWALAIEAMLTRDAGFEIQTLYSDDGIMIRFADGNDLPELTSLVPEPEDLETLIVDALGSSALFAGHFRENAGRSLLLPRRRPGSRTPLWALRLKSQQLLAVAREFPSFPIVIETYRSCLQDVFDLPALTELLHAIRSREVRLVTTETKAPSPFARSLAFAYVAAYMYETDSPLAERKAQALTLDRKLLRELLGEEEIRDLLDAAVIDQLVEELQWLEPERRARDIEDMADMLRRLGDLRADEIVARTDGDARPMIDELKASRRAVAIRVAGEERIIATEDCGLYRDALGASPPGGVPSAFLETVDRPLESILSRYARTHGPFTIGALRSRYPAQALERALDELVSRGELVHGAFSPGGTEQEWCGTEILTRIKRRTLAKLRNEVAPVERTALVRFSPAWHGVRTVGSESGGRTLEEALAQLEGLPLPYRELERVILPSRVANFHPRMLDELGAEGTIVWVGHGAHGPNDGRIALYRRDRVSRLCDPPTTKPNGDLAKKLLAHLEARGACFFGEMQLALETTREETMDALFELVFAGLVTNDTFQPLRASRDDRRVKGKRDASPTAGRFSLVSALLDPRVTPTERAHARAVLLLERHGLVTREVAAVEPLPGGFSPIYRVLRTMEEAGKTRRGHFVEGLSGAQFAFPGAVDRLRGMRSRPEHTEIRLLSALDPANPFGWLVPWPTSDHGIPRRVAGATVVIVDGELVGYLDRGDRNLLTFTSDRELLSHAIGALRDVARRNRGRMLRLESVDGLPAKTSKLADLLRGASFTNDLRGLVLEA